MRVILPSCGLGDALALTAAIREFHVSFPDEPIEVAPCEYMAVFQGNPHLSKWGSGSMGRVVFLETERHGDVGNIAVSFGLQMGCHVLDSTPELYGFTAGGDQPEVGCDRGRGVIAVDPHARALSRRWIYARWCELVESLKTAGFRVIGVGRRVIGHAGEAADPRALPVDFDYTDKLTIHETAGVISAADLFIGVDSGGVHLAAAVGTPQVGIYSRSPWYSRAYWNTTPVYFPSPCPKLCDRECSKPASPCMDNIHARHVFDAALLALRRFRHAA